MRCLVALACFLAAFSTIAQARPWGLSTLILYDISGPAADESPSRHGPTNPALFSQIIGTWQDKRCGMDINSIRLSSSGGRLTGQFTAHPVRGDVRSCSITLGEPTQLQLVNPGFDGKVLWFFLDNKGDKPEIRLLLSGKTLMFENEKGSPNPILYRKIE